MSDWAFIGTIIAALLGVVGAIYGVRKTSKIDREKLTQQWATMFGADRQTIALELKEVKATAGVIEDQLRTTKEEYAAARIEHREVIAEKNATIRERDATIRDNLIQLHETQQELLHSRAQNQELQLELIAARALIETQSAYIQEYRMERVRQGQIDIPAPRLELPHREPENPQSD